MKISRKPGFRPGSGMEHGRCTRSAPALGAVRSPAGALEVLARPARFEVLRPAGDPLSKRWQCDSERSLTGPGRVVGTATFLATLLASLCSRRSRRRSRSRPRRRRQRLQSPRRPQRRQRRRRQQKRPLSAADELSKRATDPTASPMTFSLIGDFTTSSYDLPGGAAREDSTVLKFQPSCRSRPGAWRTSSA